MKKPPARTKLVEKRSKKAGLPPGTLVYVGDKGLDPIRITYMDYDEHNFHEEQVKKIEDCFAFKTTPTVSWINIDGIHDIPLMEKLGKHYEIHPLVLEDILHTAQRPKYGEFDNYLFVVLNMLSYNQETRAVESEQVSFIIGPNYVISFQERVGDVFDEIRQRIRNAKGRIRKAAADYLAYSLIDAIVDNYFAILERIGEKIESVEEELVGNPSEKTLRQIHSIKREMISLRKSIWPLREVISDLQRSESPIMQATTGIYLRDVYDHTVHCIDIMEMHRDVISGMLDIYLSSISNRLNEVMKLLTIIATIFIPLTFLVGWYGMNFKDMPELTWRWGYPMVILVAVAMVVSMLVFFRRKQWI